MAMKTTTMIHMVKNAPDLEVLSTICIVVPNRGMISCAWISGSAKFQDVMDSNTVSPAEDYFNGAVVGFTKDDYSGERYSW